jgi:hypothetical protein
VRENKKVLIQLGRPPSRSKGIFPYTAAIVGLDRLPARQSEGIMPTIEVWVALGEDGNYEVATDEDTARERLMDGSSDETTLSPARAKRP